MAFNSLTFLLFLTALLVLNRLALSWRVRKGQLLLASYLFYAAWNPPFVLLLWISTIVDWFVAGRMAGTANVGRRRALLALSLCVNLGLLGYFKYAGFVLENFVALLGSLGIPYRPAALDIILPVGISFYTFQTLSYTLDVYRGKMKPWGSFLDFALFVTFFPQLVAGPIVRAAHFLPQCRQARRANGAQLGWGLSLLVVGLFQKVVLADACLAPVVDTVFEAPDKAGLLDAWIGALGFSGQIFFDFTGYSNCAIGVALCLGFSLPINFRYPYAAVGFSDFWRRWHISLSSWLRDYLYVSLGGNRRGAVRTWASLTFTMLLGGLWHGASWLFVVWGGLHGLYLVAERLIRKLAAQRAAPPTWPLRVLLTGMTYTLVCVAWVFFRATDFSGAARLVRTMFVGAPDELWLGDVAAVAALAVVAGMLLWHWLMRERALEPLVARMPWWSRSVALTGLILALYLTPGNDRAFIYFQF